MKRHRFVWHAQDHALNNVAVDTDLGILTAAVGRSRGESITRREPVRIKELLPISGDNARDLSVRVRRLQPLVYLSRRAVIFDCPNPRSFGTGPRRKSLEPFL